jgi:signal transduction histidine kinase/CheY-like chemotaxis protein
MIVPLRTHGRVLGSISLGSAESGRRYGAEDLVLAEELARRAAIAVDNARLYREVREADRRKDQFLAMLAHELRNPLAPIRNALHVLALRGEDSETRRWAGDIMARQTLHLGRLVDDLLDVSRITRGKIRLRRERLDLSGLVRAAVGDHRGAMEAGGLTVAAELPERPVWVLGDATRLAQVVGNLVHNAGKFTAAGGRVTVRLAVDPRERTAAVSVSDTGIGVDPALLPRLFEPFTQGDVSLDRSRGGLGLGLALVRGLVELHGGRVSARSGGTGQGAEFTFWLPLEPVPAAAPEGGAPGGCSAAALRVLVIEDHRDAAETLRVVLRLSGHDVQVAGSGPAGVALARDFQPDVVLCDLGLPGLDGYAVARELQKEPATARARLVALTGYAQDEDRQRSREAGFELHLTKPVDPGELERLLAGLTGFRRSEPD